MRGACRREPRRVARRSPWVGETISKVRLVSGSVAGMSDGHMIAGVQTSPRARLEDLLAQSRRLRRAAELRLVRIEEFASSAEVLYPAPHRFADASGTAIGYEDEVVFPVKVTPERLDEPVELKLTVDYGLCKTLCIPNQANLSIELPAHAAGKADDPLLSRFVDLVPKPAETGKLPALGGIEAKLDGTKPELIIDANFADGATGTDLFIEGPGGAFVPVPKPLGPVQNGKQRFVVSFASPAEAAAIRGKPLTLTFVSDEGAREASVTVE